ncbi:MAG: NAD(P)/FAD-dependent oxidoreductase [Acidobacteria bacterium]|nr:NAD(P)/FAD-dependent oxidoreductase [Acidobacteriota bacterium]
MNVIIIGAGHNGLTAAFYLAKAGLEPLVLEQSDTLGGGAITGELHPGFRCPTLAHYAALRADIAADMQLTRYGLEFIDGPVEAFAPALDGPPVVVYADERRTVEALRPAHAQDAEAFPRYRSAMTAVSGVLAPLVASPAPDINEPDGRDVWNLLRIARRFRALGRTDAYRLLRWMPMAVADLASEWFQSEALRALIAAPAVSGTMFGPRSAGSGLVLLLHEVTRHLTGRAVRVRGGPGALTAAMAAAARAAGAEIQTGVRVERVLVANERVTGVLAGGRDMRADAVVSAVDPKTTFLQLVEPAHLSPDFVAKIRSYRAAGTLAKVNLALSALPSFVGAGDAVGPAEAGGHLPQSAELLSGRIHIGPSLDYLERAFDHAKYGELSEAPWLDVTIPSVLDPGLAPGRAHVMSIYTHYAPYRLRSGDWPASRETLLARTLATLERVAPGIKRLVVAASVITPQELEARYGFHGGHVFHGELAPDQLVSMRPLPGFDRYGTPLRGLFVCSAGTHPGGFMSGGSGKLAAGEIIKTLRP